MLTQIQISNYKSIENLTIDLGRVNVFIGENGAGKSNVLEAIALASAAAAEKLDNEFLAARGIRVTRPEFMRSAFRKDDTSEAIKIKFKYQLDEEVTIELQNENSPYSKWHSNIQHSNPKVDFEGLKDSWDKIIANNIAAGRPEKEVRQEFSQFLTMLSEGFKKTIDAPIPKTKEGSPRKEIANFEVPIESPIQREVIDSMTSAFTKNSFFNRELKNFLVFSPENSSLRLFEKEGQIEPLGINGEGLLKLLKFYSRPEHSEILGDIKSHLSILNWFEDFRAERENSDEQLIIKDRYLDQAFSDFDQKSANEGFLFLLFYFCLFNSPITPKFFAIDNIDASLNPKLCHKLTIELVKIAKEKEKQVILTTHNPAILDGLNLDDDEQRLFVISRNRSGATKIKRVMKPMTSEKTPSYRLSELFLRGLLGGLPKGF